MGTHIAGMFLVRICGGGKGGAGSEFLWQRQSRTCAFPCVSFVLWKRCFMISKKAAAFSCSCRGFGKFIERYILLQTPDICFGDLVECCKLAYSQVAWHKYSSLECWVPLFISLGLWIKGGKT